MDKYVKHDPSAEEETELVKQIKDMMGRSVRCHLSDGRIILGSFDCVDKHRNVILDCASELKSLDEPDTKRYIGYVLIPGQHLLKFEVQED
jgi:small nuclear ribonucleoprotein (snRNP)-like protein